MGKSFLLALLVLLISTVSWAQKREIRGRVTDALTGNGLSDVSIISSDKKSATTKEDGTYIISVGATAKTLIVSHVNYTMQTIELKGETTLDIRMQPSMATMEDVVVIGYGTQRKSHLTGAIAKLKNEKLDEAPVSRLDQALQGKIAGVQIQNVTSEAGADPKIQVRGISSINAATSPLVVVDGHPIQDGLSFVNPADVESVEVLKDAASAAIYGSRGSGGVILITTKSGKAEKAKYSFKASTGTKVAYETYPMLSMTEYGNLLFYEASLKAKDPSVPALTVNQIMAANERAGYVIEQTLMGGRPTDWQQEALRSGAVRNLQLNVSGGSRTARYYISGAYQKDQGMMYHSEYDRFSIRSKLDIELSKRIKLSFNLNPTYIKRERPSTGFIDFVRFYSFLPVYHNEVTAAFVNKNPLWANIRPGDFAQARHFNGTVYTGIMPDGSNWVTTSPTDPFNTANNTPKSVLETRTITSNDYRVQTSGDLTINILKGLDFKTLGGVYVTYSSALDFAKRNSNREGELNRGQYNDRLFIDLLSENTLTYSKKIGDHSFNLLAGFTAQKTTITDEQAVGLDYPSDNITSLNNALQVQLPFVDANGNQQGTYTLKTRTGLLSVLGRLTYNYKSKYLFSASLRTDGSSRFADGHRWGYFPAVSAGWQVSEEKFMENVRWINTLKLRGSYGVTGNNRIIDYAPYDLLYSANYSLGGSNTLVSGQSPNRVLLGNQLLTWERTFQYNIGLDLTFLRSIFSLSVDAYQSKTDKLLLQQSVMAFAGALRAFNNIGSLQNRGIEAELTANIIRKKNFRWTVLGNISHNKNKILELGEEAFLLNQGERTENYRNMPGRPLVEYFGYKTDGVWLSQKQIDDAKAAGLKSSLSNLFTPGGLKLVDINNDNIIDEKDRTVIGSPYPDFIFGLTNNFTYKAFDLSFLVQGSRGGELVNGDPNYNETKRINKNYIENRWLSPMFPGDGKTPYSTLGFNWMLTDYVVEDASYYALREVIVGYTLPVKIAKLARISSARFYFSAQNLYFHTADSYRGINVEGRFTSGVYSSTLYDGYQRGSFPMPKTYLFGVDLNF